MQIVRKSSFTATPWKNGGGVTHEALRVPAEGPYRWRVSVAQVETSGPFSDFSGYRRTLVLLRGGGVRLRFAGGGVEHLHHMGDLAQFDGGLATHCDLLAGACVDMNLITANTLRVEARVDVVTAARTTTGGATSLVFVIGGALLLGNSSHATQRLEPWDLAVIPAGEASYLAPTMGAPTAGAPAKGAMAEGAKAEGAKAKGAPTTGAAAAPLAFFASLEDNLP